MNNQNALIHHGCLGGSSAFTPRHFAGHGNNPSPAMQNVSNTALASPAYTFGSMSDPWSIARNARSVFCSAFGESGLNRSDGHSHEYSHALLPKRSKSPPSRPPITAGTQFNPAAL